MDLDQDGVIDTAMATIWANEFDRSSGPACDSEDSIYFRIELMDGIDDDTWTEDADSLNIGCASIAARFAIVGRSCQSWPEPATGWTRIDRRRRAASQR